MAKRKSRKGQTTINKHTYKTKDQVTRTPLKTRGEHRFEIQIVQTNVGGSNLWIKRLVMLEWALIN